VIVAFSTSSPVASVALLEADGGCLGSRARDANMAASGACLSMLDELLVSLDASLQDARGFVADLGPGSFTGVKVGVTLAKTLAYLESVPVAGASAFDLIDPGSAVAIPCRKGEYLVRRPGEEPFLTKEIEPGTKGYGADFEHEVHPAASCFAPLLPRLEWTQPELLVPRYMLEPSISIPKRPYSQEAGR
jgi:tRNA threonylcarbamoyladenosine biosynthesis protein TsaB